MSDRLEPGDLVRLDGRPDWGLGQVQSVIGARATVNFEHGGKQLINLALAKLIVESGDPRGADRAP